MRAPCGCLVENGETFHGLDGPCANEAAVQPEPTVEDYCAADGHPYDGDEFKPEDMDDPEHGSQIAAMGGRCYCGQKRYPLGGPEPEDAT